MQFDCVEPMVRRVPSLPLILAFSSYVPLDASLLPQKERKGKERGEGGNEEKERRVTQIYI